MESYDAAPLVGAQPAGRLAVPLRTTIALYPPNNGHHTLPLLAQNLPADWQCPTCGAEKKLFVSKQRQVAGFAENQARTRAGVGWDRVGRWTARGGAARCPWLARRLAWLLCGLGNSEAPWLTNTLSDAGIRSGHQFSH